MTTTALSPQDFAEQIQEHHERAADDMRKVIVGTQSESRFAEIYGDYAHLYTHQQLEVLTQARAHATGDDADRLNRLWFEAADAVAAGDVVQAAQQLTNDRLAWRGSLDGAEHSINSLGAAIASEPSFEKREALYELLCSADAHFADRDIELADTSQRLRSGVFGLDGEVGIAEARMGIDIRKFASDVNDVSDATSESYATDATILFPAILGENAQRPSRGHAAYIRSLHEFDNIFTHDHMVEVCNKTVKELGFDMSTISTIKPDLEDRPEKDPRACVIPVKVPHEVHLVVRPTGGITDYQAFLHEAGHALHFGLTSDQQPFEFRYLSPDNALTEIYSYVVERITHEPLWHQRHFGVTEDQANEIVDRIRFVDASLYRRYAAKLSYELKFWANPTDPTHPATYASMLSDATRMTYPTAQYASDMDAGLYAADYLRAWRTSEQVLSWLRREHGPEWFCNGAAREFLNELFIQGTKPSNESVSLQIGSSPDNFDDLTAHLAP